MIRGPLFLDASVYLDVLQGRSPTEVDALLAYPLCHHSAVCLSELTYTFGRLDTIAATIEDIPAHRLHAADAAIWGQASVLAGLMLRLSNMLTGEGHERRFLNDALILLQVRQLGASVLTGNVLDFDLLTQIMQTARVILYRIGPGQRSA